MSPDREGSPPPPIACVNLTWSGAGSAEYLVSIYTTDHEVDGVQMDGNLVSRKSVRLRLEVLNNGRPMTAVAVGCQPVHSWLRR